MNGDAGGNANVHGAGGATEAAAGARVPCDAATELETLLREEREAIRRLDSPAVLSFAQRKEALIHTLRGGGTTLSASGAESLRALVPALRHNSVLLAHARDILRDAITASRSEMASPTTPHGAPVAGAAPRILSVRG